ncbi:MAG TPA: helicase HerA-like domain-containing protein [Polyangia bacterium]
MAESSPSLPQVVTAARAAFSGAASPTSFLPLGAVVHEGVAHPEPIVGLPFAMLNRHGLIAGATGTGKTKTLQLMAERLSAAGIPVFVCDVKGDLQGLATPGAASARVEQRALETGTTWQPTGCPIELFSLSGNLGAQLRATVSSFGPLALAKVLGLNDTQSSVLALVFKYCDDKQLPLLDFKDLRAVLNHLTGDGASALAEYGGISKSSVGVLLREMVALEQQGAGAFFGEPELELEDLFQVETDGRGRISILELSDVQDKPALSSTFMMWMLAEIYQQLPEVGDLDRPKLVFFFDEAHLLFRDASKAFLSQVEQVIRLVRSKGIGVFFVTQSPKDVPAEILGQLGNRVQHALRAFTPDDEKALRAAARTFPKTPFYDVPSTLTSLGIGEALVTVLSASGIPSPPFATRIAPPASRMAPLTPAELQPHLQTAQVAHYARPVDRVSAHEMLAARLRPPAPPPPDAVPPRSGRDPDPEEIDTDAYGEPPRETSGPRSRPRPPAPDQEDNAWTDVLSSPIAKSIAKEVTRGLMGALLGKRPRRRRTRLW